MSKKLRVFFLSVLIFLSLYLFGCQGAIPLTALPIQPPPSENTPEPKPAFFGNPTAEANDCLDCHSDKERLIETAKPEEEVVSENEGTG